MLQETSNWMTIVVSNLYLQLSIFHICTTICNCRVFILIILRWISLSY